MISLAPWAQVLELLSGRENISARKDNTEKNLDVSFGSLTLLVWVVYLRS